MPSRAFVHLPALFPLPFIIRSCREEQSPARTWTQQREQLPAKQRREGNRFHQRTSFDMGGANSHVVLQETRAS